MIALREAWRAGLLAPPHWGNNLLAGLVVGVVALPLAMAFAIASGAKPEQGIYTAVAASVLVSLLGGTRVQIAGPTGAFIVLLAGITARHGYDGLQIASLMAGAILVALGAARLGSIIRFIPSPVIVGFTSGIGVVIFVGQWPAFFGLPSPGPGHFLEKIWTLAGSLPSLHGPTTLLALFSLALVALAPRVGFISRLPGPLVALVAATALQAAFHWEGVATIGSAFGGIPSGLPPFHLPHVTPLRLVELTGPAFTIAVLGAIESLLSAVVADGMTGTRHDSNQELIGQGLANLAAPLMGGFAATGAIARTATGVRNGATSPLAGLTHAALLVLVLVLLSPLAAHVPLCALAAILFVVAWNMSEVKHFSFIIRRAPRADVAILLITFGLTVLADLVVAVNIGVILAMLQFMRRMSSAVEVQQLTGRELETELAAEGAGRLPPGVMVYSIEGPFFFGAVESLERALAQTHTDPRCLILRLRRVPFIDLTGLERLQEVMRHLHQRRVTVLLSEANQRVRGKLLKAGILAAAGKANYFDNLADAVVRSTEVDRTQSSPPQAPRPQASLPYGIPGYQPGDVP